MPSHSQISDSTSRLKLGVAGTGFIGSGFANLLTPDHPRYTLSSILTRRKCLPERSVQQLTDDIEQFVESCDVVVECTGDVDRTARIVSAAFAAGKPVVTLAAEFHVTLGSFFVGKGVLTEAEGDQPGSLAALREETMEMGFRPLVYGNMKGFLNHTPLLAEMEHWSGVNGISLTQVTSFTDGTKLQIEQALAANGLDGDIAARGLLGPVDLSLEDVAGTLGRAAKTLGKPIADYVLNRKLPAGVFVVGEHPDSPPEVLRYLKMGEGPFYTILRNYHLCHLEMFKTIRRVTTGGGILLDNSANPSINVAAVVKRPLSKGTRISQAIGGFDLRGEAVRFTEAPDSVPIGLLQGAVVKETLEPGQTVTWADVELPDNMASSIGLQLREARLSLAS